MATNSQLIAQISQELLDELTAGGTRDLTNVRLSQMEAEVYGLADRIAERLLRGMVEDQSAQDQTACCPCCQGPLEDRPPDAKSLQLERCSIHWEQPAKRCQKCRRDFFPSGGDVGMCGGGEL